jgi:hypothetical protein
VINALIKTLVLFRQSGHLSFAFPDFLKIKIFILLHLPDLSQTFQVGLDAETFAQPIVVLVVLPPQLRVLTTQFLDFCLELLNVSVLFCDDHFPPLFLYLHLLLLLHYLFNHFSFLEEMILNLIFVKEGGMTRHKFVVDEG